MSEITPEQQAMKSMTAQEDFYVVWSRGDETPVKVTCDFLGLCKIENNTGIFGIICIFEMIKRGALILQPLEISG